MKKLVIIISLLALAVSVHAQSTTFPSVSRAVTDNVLSSVSNPAWLGARDGFEFFWASSFSDSISGDDLSLGVKTGGLGFAGEFVHNDYNFYNRYTIAHGAKLHNGFYLGLSYNWYRVVDWDGGWNIGLGFRPLPYVSAGLVINDLNRPERDGVELEAAYGLALAVRPFGHRYTFSGDLLLTQDEGHDYGEELDPVFRLEALPWDGIRFTGEYRTESQTFGVGLSLAIDNVVAGFFSNRDDEGEHSNSVQYLHFSSARHNNIFSPQSHQFVEVNLSGEMHESSPPFSFFKARGKTMRQLRHEIAHYANDPKVEGLLLRLDNPKFGLAQAQQIRRALEEFKAKGKKLIAYAEDYTQSEYYLATVCDEIYLMPIGSVDLKGLSAVLGYWKETLDKLGVEVQVARVRDHKTIANPALFADTPEAEAEMMNWLLDDIYKQMIGTIGEGRGWSAAETDEVVDGGPYYSNRALESGLVDDIRYLDEVKEELKKGDYRLVSEKGYWRSPVYEEKWPDPRTPKVAVIYAEGAMLVGESGGGFFNRDEYMGSKTMAKAIRQAREDRSVDAIILRVDSPGGTALATEEIYREVLRTVSEGKNRKPVIVSMGNVAASGGYYIASAADTIIAEASTITGSIGVSGGKFSLAKLYDKIYYNTHTFKRGEQADAFGMHRAHTEQEMEMLQEAVEQIYDQFITNVAERRPITKAEVNTVGEGRVWTGKQAQERGLVDLIGGMDLAFKVTHAKLGVAADAPLELEYLPKGRGLFSSISTEVSTLSGKNIPSSLQDALQPLVMMAEFYDGEPLMLMNYGIEIE